MIPANLDTTAHVTLVGTPSVKAYTGAKMVIDAIANDANLRRLIERLPSAGQVVHANGLWGSSAPMVTALAAAARVRTFLYVTAHAEQADNARDDLELFSGGACRILPAWDTLPGSGAASGEIQAERLRLCTDLQAMRASPESLPSSLIIAAPIQSLMQPTPTQALLERNTIQLCTDPSSEGASPMSPEALLEWAVERGFERLDLVESPGDVAMRGDIVDLYVPGESRPYRVEFFDTQIESIRTFDAGTQRSVENHKRISVSALKPGESVDEAYAEDFFAYLPDDALIVLDGPAEIQEMGDTIRNRVGDSDRLFPVSDVLAKAVRFGQMHIGRFGTASTSGETVVDFGVKSTHRFEMGAAEAVAELCRVAEQSQVHVMCDNDGERRRLTEMLASENAAIGDRIKLHIGMIHRGFDWSTANTVVVGHHEIFRRQRQRRRIRRLQAGRPLESWTDLSPGDIVVHAAHGIAKYRGLAMMNKGASEHCEEYLTLEFDGGGTVHVPSSQIDLVQKYIGAGGRRPQLSKLGGKRWSRSKEQVEDAVAELAESLLRVQAMRDAAKGIAYPADTDWQREFEASFIYEETEDQLVVARETREDLCAVRPMDRLICGDVGYGKTELAMRAAFKVAEYGRQVAVLVPTTVLAEQHAETFRERFADYPFVVECLSRFRSGREQKKIIDALRRGQVDIIIGTHRLLSKDIVIPNLGLLIIDEEQRFGVEHKERLKAMRSSIDILTLTATPIPRTLHMALTGIRSISSLQTPPVDRRSIATQVCGFDRSRIREGILREMNRDGQVFFVHNFVRSIAAMAETVKSIVPEARVIYGHGQMEAGALERVMRSFMRREADVLVATTIIESGIDMPSVNTIFINRAERFGLADLHQLRGRVGRSDHRAFCYLLLSPEHPPTSKAAKRLKTIEEFSELGAGFRIAMRDLEIRGAGNLLGRQQSGHIAVVGYDMYCQLLERTIRRLKNEPDQSPRPVQVDLDVAAHIPPHYIEAERARIEVYRRVTAAQTVEELERLDRDLVDAFGAYPDEVSRLLELAQIRVYARRFGIESITLRPPDVIFTVKQLTVVEPVFAAAPGSARMPDSKTVHLRLPPRYLEPGTLLPVLRRMLTSAFETQETAAS